MTEEKTVRGTALHDAHTARTEPRRETTTRSVNTERRERVTSLRLIVGRLAAAQTRAHGDPARIRGRATATSSLSPILHESALSSRRSAAPASIECQEKKIYCSAGTRLAESVTSV